ncbi:hypothetical protein JCM21142_93987 [Saccharicrinis fermentans DSM 9555 = JCM 21142]|uniref:Uncharacterized protein n=2 Tax=Saccharicrinis fermentans TaxID=982 RepID=W7Y346_9BACT|nr:hypothetical protein JCM21142_93987 [Saccharicrinis fermentans DSM 9555 = JCM 21142]
MHYCGGEYVSTSINKEAKSCCDGTGGCCENKSLHFEVKDDYVNAVQFETTKIVSIDILFPILLAINLELFPEEINVIKEFIDTSPPPKIQTRLSLLQTYLC